MNRILIKCMFYIYVFFLFVLLTPHMFHKGATTYTVALCHAFFFTLILAITGMIGYHSVVFDPFLTIDQVNPDTGVVDSSVTVNMEEVPDPKGAEALLSLYGQLSPDKCIYNPDHSIFIQPQQDLHHASYDSDLCAYYAFQKSYGHSFGVDNSSQCWYGDICANMVINSIFNDRGKTSVACNMDGNIKLYIPNFQLPIVQSEVDSGLGIYLNQAIQQEIKEQQRQSKQKEQEQDTAVVNKIDALSANINRANRLVKQSDITPEVAEYLPMNGDFGRF